MAEISEPLPTVAIGVGKAGIEIVETLQNVVPDEYQDHFEYLVLDSNQRTLNASSITKTQYLSVPSEYLKLDRKRYPYLTEDMAIESKGAERQRPVGRYKLDNRQNPSFSTHFKNIEDTIVAHYNEHSSQLQRSDNHLNIFFAHSLGGGTGSGTFPLMLAILDTIAEGLRDRYDQFVYLAGVGVVPMAYYDGKVVQLPGQDSRYYPNSYTSLRDLKHLLSAREGEDRTVRVPVYARRFSNNFDSTGENINTALEENAFELTSPPFNDYYIVGVNEDKITGEPESSHGESYAETIDRTVAMGLYAISKTGTDMENISGQSDTAPYIGTMTEMEVAVPREQLQTYCGLRETIQELELTIYGGEEPAGDEDSVKQLMQNPELVFSAYEDREAIAERERELEKIIHTVLGEGLNTANKEPADIDETLARIEESAGLRFVPLGIRKIEQNLDRIKTDVEENFKNEVTELWKHYDMYSKEKYGGATTVTGKASNLDDFLREEISHFERQLETTDPSFWDGKPIITGARERIQSYLHEDRDSLDVLQEVQNQYQNYQSLVKKTDRERDTILKRLRGKKQALDDARINLGSLEDELTDRGRSGRRVGYLPIEANKLPGLTLEKLENGLTSIADFLNEGYIDRELFNQALVTHYERCQADNEWVLEMNPDPDEVAIEVADRVTKDAWSYILFSDENSSIIDVSAAGSVKNPLTSGNAAGYLQDTDRIVFISYARALPIDGLQLYQWFKRYAEDGTFDRLVRQWDYDHRRAYAYPEWYGRDIRQAFSVSQTLDLHGPPEMSVDFVTIDAGSEGELKNELIKRNGVVSYLYQGAHWEAYDDPENSFLGWKSSLDEVSIDWQDLQRLSPTAETKRRWLAGHVGWAELLEEFKDNFEDREGIQITFVPTEESEID